MHGAGGAVRAQQFDHRLVVVRDRARQGVGGAFNLRIGIGPKFQEEFGDLEVPIGGRRIQGVAAIRRGTRLALAMEARGFGTRPCRTIARVQVVRRADWLLIGAALLLASLAVGVSLGIGSWRFVLG